MSKSRNKLSPKFKKYIDLLQNTNISPIGYSAQKELDPIPKQRTKTPQKAKQAAVMCLLIEKLNEPHIVLMKRTAHPLDKHKGQVSFVGGSVETGDSSLYYTAIRETEEEIGLSMEEIELITPLTSIYIPISNFEMHPFLGFYKGDLNYQLEISEVAAVIEVPLSALFDDENLKYKNIKMSNNLLLKNAPYFELEGHDIWGATAMVLSEIKTILSHL